MIKVLTGINSGSCLPLLQLIVINYQRILIIGSYFIILRILRADQSGKFNNMDPLFLPEIGGHLISGNIKNRKTGEPVKTENISLSFVGKTALCQFAKTNEKGEFHFNTSEHGITGDSNTTIV